MTISSLSGYAALLNLQSQQTTSTSTSTTDASNSASVGDEIVALLKNSQSASDPLLQDTVTLSPAALGQTSTSSEPLTYDAKGLLKQAQSIQNSVALNDPLLSDSTDSSFDDSSTEINPGSLFNSI
jgi:hypothetical protein